MHYMISSFFKKTPSTLCIAKCVALADFRHYLLPQSLAQVGGAPLPASIIHTIDSMTNRRAQLVPLGTPRLARRRNAGRGQARLSLPCEHMLTSWISVLCFWHDVQSHLHTRKEAIPLARRVIRQIFFGRNPHDKHAAVHLPSHHPDGVHYARVVESPDSCFERQC